MTVAVRHGLKVWQRRERAAQFAIWAAWLVGVAVLVVSWSFISEKTIWPFVLDAPQQAADLGVRMVPPDWSSIGQLWRPMWDTINMATLGTLMGVALAVQVAY